MNEITDIIITTLILVAIVAFMLFIGHLWNWYKSKEERKEKQNLKLKAQIPPEPSDTSPHYSYMPKQQGRTFYVEGSQDMYTNDAEGWGIKELLINGGFTKERSLHEKADVNAVNGTFSYNNMQSFSDSDEILLNGKKIKKYKNNQ